MYRKQNGGGLGPVALWAQLEAKLKVRLASDRTFHDGPVQTLTGLPRGFLAPNGSNKYVEWVVRSYLKGGIKLYEDIQSRAYPAIDDFLQLVSHKILSTGQKGQPRTNETDINNYCGLAGCQHDGAQVPGLDTILVKHTKETIIDASLPPGHIVIGPQAAIYQPTTMVEAQNLGKRTKWCTAAKKDGNMFEHYNSRGLLYIIFPKHPEHSGEKYQLHFKTDQYMNELDKEVSLFVLLARFPEIKQLFTVIHDGADLTIYEIAGKKLFISKKAHISSGYEHGGGAEDEYRESGSGYTGPDGTSLDFRKLLRQSPDFLKLYVIKAEDNYVTIYESPDYHNVLVPKKPSRVGELYILDTATLSEVVSCTSEKGRKITLGALLWQFPTIKSFHQMLYEGPSVWIIRYEGAYTLVLPKKPRNVDDVYIFQGDSLRGVSTTGAPVSLRSIFNRFPDYLKTHKRLYEDTNVSVYEYGETYLYDTDVHVYGETPILVLPKVPRRAGEAYILRHLTAPLESDMGHDDPLYDVMLTFLVENYPGVTEVFEVLHYGHTSALYKYQNNLLAIPTTPKGEEPVIYVYEDATARWREVSDGSFFIKDRTFAHVISQCPDILDATSQLYSDAEMTVYYSDFANRYIIRSAVNKRTYTFFVSTEGQLAKISVDNKEFDATDELLTQFPNLITILGRIDLPTWPGLQ